MICRIQAPTYSALFLARRTVPVSALGLGVDVGDVASAFTSVTDGFRSVDRADRIQNSGFWRGLAVIRPRFRARRLEDLAGYDRTGDWEELL